MVVGVVIEIKHRGKTLSQFHRALALYVPFPNPSHTSAAGIVVSTYEELALWKDHNLLPLAQWAQLHSGRGTKMLLCWRCHANRLLTPQYGWACSQCVGNMDIFCGAYIFINKIHRPMWDIAMCQFRFRLVIMGKEMVFMFLSCIMNAWGFFVLWRHC